MTEVGPTEKGPLETTGREGWRTSGPDVVKGRRTEWVGKRTRSRLHHTSRPKRLEYENFHLCDSRSKRKCLPYLRPSSPRTTVSSSGTGNSSGSTTTESRFPSMNTSLSVPRPPLYKRVFSLERGPGHTLPYHI